MHTHTHTHIHIHTYTHTHTHTHTYIHTLLCHLSTLVFQTFSQKIGDSATTLRDFLHKPMDRLIEYKIFLKVCSDLLTVRMD